MIESGIYYKVETTHIERITIMPIEPSVVQSVRLPRELWNDIKALADITDRSFNRVVLRMLQKQIEQEKEAQKKESRAI
jgi:hypothetical protein